MRRIALLLPIALFAIDLARAQDPPRAADDGFLWDPRKTRVAKIGDRTFTDSKEETHDQFRFVVAGHASQGTNERIVLRLRAVREVLGVDAQQKPVKERWALETWRRDHDGVRDRSLEGRALIVEIHNADTRTAQIEGDTPSAPAVSAEARAWIDERFVKKNPRGPELDALLMPKGPIGDGVEWNVNAADVAAVLLEGVKIQPKGSVVKAKLSNVHVDDGVHVGHLEWHIALRLDNVPGTHIRWREGGTLESSMEIDASLEPEKSARGTTKVHSRLRGKADRMTEAGFVLASTDNDYSSEVKEGEMKPGERLPPYTEAPPPKPKNPDDEDDEPPSKGQ